MLTYSIDNIAIIIVIYNRKLSDCDAFNSLKVSTKSCLTNMLLVVVDNSPFPMYNGEIYDGFLIRYIHNPDNPGVSKAYNQGFKIAIEYSKKWLLLTDQDTVYPEETLQLYLDGIAKFPNQKIFVPRLYYSKGLFSPVRYLFKRGWSLSSISVGIHKFNFLSVVNSGILIDSNLFKDVGGYNERVKLDFSDYVFIDKIKNNNKTFTVLDINCQQEVSSEVNNNLVTSLNRFKYFCSGAKNSINIWYDYPVVFIYILLRTLKLSVSYNTTLFFQYFFSYFIKEKNI